MERVRPRLSTNPAHSLLKMTAYTEQLFIRKNTIEKRAYQEVMVNSAIKSNSLVVLPTGLGKTPIAALVCAHRLEKFPEKKILFLAPTKPLAEQHRKYFEKVMMLDKKDFVLLTGKISPGKRKQKWRDGKIFFCTPEVVENDVLTRSVDMNDFCLCIFDEAHRAAGDYAYVFIAKEYSKVNGSHILALTASPGGKEVSIRDICANLFIKNIEIKTEEDETVKPYIKELDIAWEKIELPKQFKRIKELFERAMEKQIIDLKNSGYLKTSSLRRITKKELLTAQIRIRRSIGRGDVSAYSGASKIASVIKAYHALELLETQGIAATYNYLERLKAQKSRAVRFLYNDDNFLNAGLKVKWLYEKGIEHPKIDRLSALIKEQLDREPDSLVIVFTQYRDSINKIIQELRKKGIGAEKLVGQSSRIERGMSQKEQVEVLNRFRDREFNVLVASSVGEEGLDLPSVSVVFFFEPIPSELRVIQRRGRTARHCAGKVIILIAKDTRDEAYLWSAFHREKKMKRTLRSMRKSKQKVLGEF